MATARVASADGTLPNIYAGIVGGYTVTVDLPEGAPDPMGLALGVRAGLTLPTTSIDVGGLFLYHAGDSVRVDAAGASAEVSSSSRAAGDERPTLYGIVAGS